MQSPAVYKLQLSLVPMNPQQNLHTIVLEEHLACPRCGYFFCEGCWAANGPEYQGMQYREPISRPNREFRKAEPQYQNHLKHESSESGAILVEEGANDNTRGGKVRRTPSKNSLMVDRADLEAEKTLRQGSK